MKLRVAFLFSLLLTLLSANAVTATPVYYTFTGQVSSEYGTILDDAGIIVENGIDYGTAVEYVLLIDFDLQGQYTRNDGSVVTFSDYTGEDYSADYFYVDFISGSLIEEKDGGYYNGSSYQAENNYGRDYDDSSHSDGFLAVESADEYTQIGSSLNGPISELVVGDIVFGFERALDSNHNQSYFWSTLELTSISDAAPVPEPTTVLLLGTGLLGLAGFSRKRIKK